MILAFAESVVCPAVGAAAFWDRIEGWQVVIAVVIVVSGVVAINVTRLHYMAVIARVGNPCEYGKHEAT